jgi:hypothetical protein
VEEASSRRMAAMWSLSIAGAAFAVFLLVAFFIVFVRMEKHLDRLAEYGGKRVHLDSGSQPTNA